MHSLALRDNISFTVHSKTDVAELTTALCREFASKRSSFLKTVIHVRASVFICY
jgi:hypothetical protein